MASGVIQGSTNNKYISSRIEWSSVPDRLTAVSTVTAIFSAMKSSKSSEGTSGSGSWTLKIGDISQTFTKTMTLPNDDSWHEIGQSTVQIAHDSDGSKSIQILGTGGTLRTSWSSTNCSGVAVLDLIPRETIPTFDAATKNFGSTLTINLAPAEPTFVHDVSVQWQGVATQIKSGFASGSIVYPIPSAWMTAIPNADTATMYVIVSTYDGERLVGVTTSPVALTVPSSVVPTISSVVLTDTGGVVPAAWDLLVKGKSTLHVKANASGVYGSTVAAYQIEALDQTRSANDIDIGPIVDAGLLSVKVTVYDSRGRSATKTVSHDVVDYASPAISDIKIERANNQGIPVDNGTFLKLTLSASVSPIDDHNSLTIKIYHQRSDASTRTLARTIAPGSLSIVDQVYMVGNMEASRSYEITVEIVDYFGEPTTQSGILPAEGGVISWKNGGTGVAFGKAAEEDYRADFGWMIHGREGATFDVPLPVESGGTGSNTAAGAVVNLGAAPAKHSHTIDDLPTSSIVDLIYPIGSIYITTNSADPSTIFTGTEWEQIKDRFLLSAGDTYFGGSDGGSASHNLSATHNHLAPIGYNSGAVGAVDINGITSGGNKKTYRTANIDYHGTLSTNVTMMYTDDAIVEETIPTMPPYLVVYVWTRTK